MATKEVWIQNKTAKIINVGSLKLKPAFPQKITDLEGLKNKYPAFKEKMANGLIVILDALQAENQRQAVEEEINNRLKAANMI